MEDLEAVRKLDPLQPGLMEQEQHLHALISRSKQTDAALLQKMLPS